MNFCYICNNKIITNRKNHYLCKNCYQQVNDQFNTLNTKIANLDKYCHNILKKELNNPKEKIEYMATIWYLLNIILEKQSDIDKVMFFLSKNKIVLTTKNNSDLEIINTKNKEIDELKLELKKYKNFNYEQLKKEIEDQQNEIYKLNAILKYYKETINNQDVEILNLNSKLNKIQKEEKKVSYNIMALNTFKNIEEFNNYAKELYDIDNWIIESTSYKDKLKKYSKNESFIKLKTQFNNLALHNKNINDEQVLSFFDTMHIMHKIFKEINNSSIKEEMKIIMEYFIEDASKERPDYLLIYRNTILIIEFSYQGNNRKLKSRIIDKTKQVENYKSKLKNLLDSKYNSNNIKIIGITCVYSNSKDTTEQNIKEIIKHIENFTKNHNNATAFEFLEEL